MEPASSRHDSILLQLLTQARAGDDAAREALFGRCRQYVQLLARTQVETWMRGKVDPSDLVQQTLLEAHRGFREFRGGSPGEWLAWLRKILSHNTQDFIRRFREADKRAIEREVSLDAPLPGLSGSFRLDPVDDGQPTPSQILAQQEQEIELANAIGRLSEDHQAVIVLRNLQRLPFDEVARRLQRSRPAAQMLWMRAMQKLEEELRRDQ